jgi:mono/diheme cytochrome c family protein
MNRKLLSIMILALVVASVSFAAGPGAADNYKSKCATCHGPDGKGGTTVGKSMKVRDLSAPDVQRQSDTDLQKIISDGKGKMPPYKAKLSVADISSLVAYIRGLARH